MLLLHIVFTYFLTALLVKTIQFFFTSNHSKVIIITSHNNAIIGYLQYFSTTILPKTVLPNGAVIKLVICNNYVTISLLTKDGEHEKFLKKDHILAAFPYPVPFNAPNSIVYLVRHGESESNVGLSHVNPSLTAAGVEDAVRAGEAIISDLEGNPKIILVSSPLTRAVQTIENIRRILSSTKPIILDVRTFESVRDIGRPIHVRGPNTDARTITACNPYLPLMAYRNHYICDPFIEEAELENLVSPNKLPQKFDFADVSTELLEKQLTYDWCREAALTSLDTLITSHM